MRKRGVVKERRMQGSKEGDKEGNYDMWRERRENEDKGERKWEARKRKSRR